MKVLKFAFVFVIVAMILAACAPTVQGLVALPEEAQLLILTLLTAGLTWLLVQLGKVIPVDFSGYAGPIAAVLSPVIVTFVESYLQMIPPVFDDLVLAVIHFIVLLIGSIGAYMIVGKTKNKQLKLLPGG